MSAFKTPKGTELPLLSLKGKDYLEVKYRLIWFREERPNWGIRTEVFFHDDSHSVVKASIIATGNEVVAVGHKREDAKHFPDHLEKAETGAIGRALALIGFGTQFAPELDEGDRIVDSPVERRSPGGLPKPAGAESAAPNLNQRLGLGAQAQKPIVDTRRRQLYDQIKKHWNDSLLPFRNEKIVGHLQAKYGFVDAQKMTVEQLEEFLLWLEHHPFQEEPALEKLEKLPEHPLDNFVMEVGSVPPKGFKGRTFKQMMEELQGREGFEKWFKEIHAWFLAEKKPITAKWSATFKAAEEYLYGNVPSGDDGDKEEEEGGA